MTACCGTPALSFAWRLGYTEEQHLVVMINGIHCQTCGTKFLFGSSDPNVPEAMISPARNELVVAVVKKAETIQ